MAGKLAGGGDATVWPEIRVPAAPTFAGLVAGLAIGLALAESAALPGVVAVAGPVGTLWLRALQMTILPLVAGLLFTGIVETVRAARAGAMARRTLLLFAMVLLTGGAMAALVMPVLLALWPIPQSAAAALRPAEGAGSAAVPGFADFLNALIPANVVEAAAANAMLPVVAFVALLALASTRLDAPSRDLLARFFAALAGAMMVMVGWILRLAPLGVFALALPVAAQSGSGAIAALAHYIVLVSGIGAVVLVGAYALAMFAARLPLPAFARAMLPAQAVALSTQSSLASLPAMLAACRTLGLRETTADFVLPLAVTLLRATSVAMNMAVAIYAAHLAGVTLGPAALAAGVLVGFLISLGNVSLPGTLSFVASVGPIALAMGAPVAPLALLVAVEMLPDMMRTLANVTMDVAVAATVDRNQGDSI